MRREADEHTTYAYIEMTDAGRWRVSIPRRWGSRWPRAWDSALSTLHPVRRKRSRTFAEAVQYVTDSASRASGRTVVGVDVHNRPGRLWAITRQGLRERLDDVMAAPVDPVVVATDEGPLYFLNFAIRQRSAMDDEVVDEDLGLP